MSIETRLVDTEHGPVLLVMGDDSERHRRREEVVATARRATLPTLLASVMALASPMMSGQPPLDTGSREYELTLAGPAPRRRRERRTVDGSLIDTDTVSDQVQCELLSKAASKRARRAVRGW